MSQLVTQARILVVEDEAIVSTDIQERLTALGYTVVGIARSGEAAIEQAALLNPDLVLMDIILEGEMLGTEAADQIRLRMRIPVIYLTANSNETTFFRARDTEPFGFILKPFDEATLRVNIEIALYKHRMERERDELVNRLRDALAQVKTLSGIIPICGWCKNIRNDKGYWESVERYVQTHSEADFTHSICPECSAKVKSEINELVKKPKGVSGEQRRAAE